MRKFSLLFMVGLLLASVITTTSCRRENTEGSDGKNDSLNLVLGDSLATALAERDTLLALMNEVGESMNRIVEMQNIVTSTDLNNETPSQKNKLKNDVIAIQKALQDRTKKIHDLEARLANSTNYNEVMKQTIVNLKKQVQQQQELINSLTAQLQAAHIEIATLNTRVDSLRTENRTVKEEKAQAQASATKAREDANRLNTQVNELNYCYYAIGSKKELKKNKIIETGFLRKTKIMESDYSKSYFTRADKRTLIEIPLHSKKAKVISNHPSGSYSIVDENGQKVLKIHSTGKFWELSNYLIIQID